MPLRRRVVREGEVVEGKVLEVRDAERRRQAGPRLLANGGEERHRVVPGVGAARGGIDDASHRDEAHGSNERKLSEAA